MQSLKQSQEAYSSLLREQRLGLATSYSPIHRQPCNASETALQAQARNEQPSPYALPTPYTNANC